MILLGTEVRLSSPGLPFFPFSKMGVLIHLFQSVGTSLDCYNFSNMMDSGLATSTSSLRTHGYTSSDTMDSCTSSPTAGSSSFSLTLPLPSATWAVQPEHLPMKTEAKMLLSTSAFSISQGNQFSCFLLTRAHIFPSLLFITDVPIQALLIALEIPSQI